MKTLPIVVVKLSICPHNIALLQEGNKKVKNKHHSHIHFSSQARPYRQVYRWVSEGHLIGFDPQQTASRDRPWPEVTLHGLPAATQPLHVGPLPRPPATATAPGRAAWKSATYWKGETLPSQIKHVAHTHTQHENQIPPPPYKQPLTG